MTRSSPLALVFSLAALAAGASAAFAQGPTDSAMAAQNGGGSPNLAPSQNRSQGQGQGQGQAPGQSSPSNEAQMVYRKATPAERAAADRLEPLARAVFWQHESDADPTDAAAGVSLSRALRAIGRNDEADAAAARVLVLTPDNEEALLEQAKDRIAEHQGFYAIPGLRRAAQIAPKDWRPLSLLGVAYGQAERPDESRKAYLAALKLAPENPAVLSNLGLSYAETGEADKAEALLRKAVGEKDATLQERQNLALFLGLHGRMPEAESLIREDLPPQMADQNIAYLRSLVEADAKTRPAATAPPPVK